MGSVRKIIVIGVHLMLPLVFVLPYGLKIGVIIVVFFTIILDIVLVIVIIVIIAAQRLVDKDLSSSGKSHRRKTAWEVRLCRA